MREVAQHLSWRERMVIPEGTCLAPAAAGREPVCFGSWHRLERKRARRDAGEMSAVVLERGRGLDLGEDLEALWAFPKERLARPAVQEAERAVRHADRLPQIPPPQDGNPGISTS